jgi:hypothetical protein
MEKANKADSNKEMIKITKNINVDNKEYNLLALLTRRLLYIKSRHQMNRTISKLIRK